MSHRKAAAMGSGDLWRRFVALVTGATWRERRAAARQREQKREEERRRWIEHEQFLNRMRAENRREMIRAVSDPSIVPSVRARLMEALLDERR